MQQLPVVTELPAPFNREIGRIISKWATLDWQVSACIYATLKLSPKAGRLAVKDTRIVDRIDCLKDLLEIDNIGVTTDMEVLKKSIEIATIERDRLAHGIWVKDRSFYFLRIAKGTWQPQKGMRGKIKRLIKPQAKLITLEELRETTKLIDAAMLSAKALFDEIELHHDLATSQTPAPPR